MSDGMLRPTDLQANPENRSEKTAGSMLRAAREREGLHIAALAVSMKVPVKKLEALEADRFDLLPDAVFVRALASSVCRTLKLDPIPVLDRLPANPPPRLHADDRGINTPFDGPGRPSSLTLANTMLRPPVVLVILLLLAAIGVYFFPQPDSKIGMAETEQVFPRPTSPEISVDPAPPVAPTVVEAAPSVSGTSTALASAAVPPQSSASPSNLELSPAVNHSAPARPDPLMVRANGSVWVQVTDAKGVQLISKTLQTGEVAGVSGALPFAVVIGRADLTAVELHGRPFDLAAIAQNNVARFEVKP